MAVAVFTISVILEKRRSFLGIGIFLEGKILVQIILLNSILPYFYGDAQWLLILNSLCSLTMAVLLYVMYCYTFQGEFLKIAVAAWIGELTTAFFGYFSLAVINQAAGRENIWTAEDNFLPMDLLFPVVDLALLAVFFHFAGPALRKLRNYQFRHRKVLWEIGRASCRERVCQYV